MDLVRLYQHKSPLSGNNRQILQKLYLDDQAQDADRTESANKIAYLSQVDSSEEAYVVQNIQPGTERSDGTGTNSEGSSSSEERVVLLLWT